MPYFIYILRSNTNKLYIGQTNNLKNRFDQHQSKNSKSAKFTKEGDVFSLVYNEKYKSRIEAMHRELQLKGWTRAKKEALITGEIYKLKCLSKKKL